MLADDHPAFLQGVAHHFSRNAEFETPLLVNDGQACLELIKRVEPDWAIIDLAMPRLTGFDVLDALLSSHISTRVIVLSMHADKSYAAKAERLGACAFIAKEDTLGEIDKAMSNAADRFYTSASVGRPTNVFVDKSTTLSLHNLTDQEKRVLTLLGNGQTSREIAAQLSISPRTVQAHRRNMAEKLDLQGPNRLLQFAIEQAQSRKS